MRKYIILLFCFLLSLGNLSAQRNSTLIGVVKDEQGQGLPGVAVYVKSAPSIGVQTDYYGNFELKNIPEGKQKIIVFMLGMGEEEIIFTGQESAIITLHEQSSTLDDVVVTGIVTRNKNSFTGSAATFTSKEIKMVSAGNLFQSIQTLEPSMTIVENNLRGADPNAMPDLEIRGKTSIVGELDSEYSNIPNQPLFILDGMEVDIDISTATDHRHKGQILKLLRGIGRNITKSCSHGHSDHITVLHHRLEITSCRFPQSVLLPVFLYRVHHNDLLQLIQILQTALQLRMASLLRVTDDDLDDFFLFCTL